MTLAQAKEIVGNCAGWELAMMRKALSFCPILNSQEENERLQAIKMIQRQPKARGART